MSMSVVGAALEIYIMMLMMMMIQLYQWRLARGLSTPIFPRLYSRLCPTTTASRLPLSGAYPLLPALVPLRTNQRIKPLPSAAVGWSSGWLNAG